MSGGRRGAPAVAALAVILAITVAWWALALWPLGSAAPDWVARTREVCFGAVANGLPNAGGWVLLIGQPLGMVLLLVVIWGAELRAGLGASLEHVAGQIALGVAAAAVVIGSIAVGARVREAGAQEFDPGSAAGIASALTRISDVPPALALVSERGRTVTLDDYRGRAVLVTFAYAHCETVCPLLVHSALAARDEVAASSPERTPAVLVLTLDPWRDTPARLTSLAAQWGMSGDAHVLSGEPETVERTLNAWRIPRVRNERTGEIVHPSVVYVIGPNGRITFVVNGSTEQIVAALRAL